MIQGQIEVDGTVLTSYTITQVAAKGPMDTYEFLVNGFTWDGEPFGYSWTEDVSMLSNSCWELTVLIMDFIKKQLTGYASA